MQFTAEVTVAKFTLRNEIVCHFLLTVVRIGLEPAFGRRGGLVLEHRTPVREVGFVPHSGRRVVSLSKKHLLP